MSQKFKKILLSLTALGVVFLVYAHFETYWIQVLPTTIASNELPAEFGGKKIAFIADVHCDEGFGVERIEGLVEKINSLKPDILLIGGDYGKCTEIFFKEMAKINTPLGKFAIFGNHDIETGTDLIKKAMAGSGITTLVNENRKITIGEAQITIAGSDESWYGKPDGAKAMENTSLFAIYLTHDPWYLEQYRPAAKLLLAGHTHGGQVTLFGVPFAGLAHGRNYKYEKGIFNEHGRTIIVTNGIGATILPLRFFARPQINLITLKNSNKNI